jgi:hypothetical protein
MQEYYNKMVKELTIFPQYHDETVPNATQQAIDKLYELMDTGCQYVRGH